MSMMWRAKIKEIMNPSRFTSKCQVLCSKRDFVSQFCYRTQLLLGFVAVLCYVIIIPKHYNTDFANIDKAIIEDVDYEKRLSIENERLSNELEPNFYGNYEFGEIVAPTDTEDPYNYGLDDEYEDEIRNEYLRIEMSVRAKQLEYQRKYDWNQWSQFEGFQNHGKQQTKTRAIFGCVNSLLFMISAILGIVTDKLGSRIHGFISLVASVAAGLFCVIVFLPVFNFVLFDYVQELGEIKKYDESDTYTMRSKYSESIKEDLLEKFYLGNLLYNSLTSLLCLKYKMQYQYLV